tara:strand:+ start:2011 stop:3279 length:1269 start_codon:yes stop_codon:yes gene_type:complete
MMKAFTGWQYLLIDAANQFGHDKLSFEERIAWTTNNMHNLEKLAEDNDFKERPLYLKAVMAIRAAQRNEPTGHLVGFDAVCSGMQIASAMAGCYAGAQATGLVDLDRRADAYTDVTTKMANLLGNTVTIARKKVKNAVMTALYASKKEPKKEFGEDTPELDAFWKALYAVAPGACDLLEDMIKTWVPYALSHSWKLPDGFTAHVKVMVPVEHRIEVDELSHSTFEYRYLANIGQRSGVKNPANIIHSVDAYVLRSLLRRCNYDTAHFTRVAKLISIERFNRRQGSVQLNTQRPSRPAIAVSVIDYYVEQYQRSNMADVVIVPHIDNQNIRFLSDSHLIELQAIVNTVLEYKPFEVIAVHDEFKCHPNHMNTLRNHYRNILAELSDSELLTDLLCQIRGVEGSYEKASNNLGQFIRQSNYGLS